MTLLSEALEATCTSCKYSGTDFRMSLVVGLICPKCGSDYVIWKWLVSIPESKGD
jgi:predicted RNA-binding Zn-ribbon protein involved in translation (DUF1610 family)